jgi:hypothetical protein
MRRCNASASMNKMNPGESCCLAAAALLLDDDEQPE